MLLQVNFYILPTKEFDKFLQTCCRIIEKIYRSKHHLFIYTNNAAMTNTIDEKLWTFKDNVFLPHTVQEISVPNCPIIISHLAPHTDSSDILLNLTDEVPTFYSQFKKVIEVVYQDNENKIKSRNRFRFYNEKNCNIQTYSL